MTLKFVSYLRVSTQKQGKSGLGLEAQREAIRSYLTDKPKEFLEVETGTAKRERPVLAQALEHCRLTGAALVVAKVDRLTRSVGFLHRILESGVEVRFCDLTNLEGPQGKFMLTQMAAVAELEAGLISQRTKAALTAAKARGVKLGNPNGAASLRRYADQRGAKLNAHGVDAVKLKADSIAFGLASLLKELRIGKNLVQIAKKLNRLSIKTPRGGRWYATSVSRLLSRLDRTKVS